MGAAPRGTDLFLAPARTTEAVPVSRSPWFPAALVAAVLVVVVALPAQAQTAPAAVRPTPVAQVAPAAAPWSAGRAYAQGAVVVHGGRRWVAAMPSAGWAPGAGAEVGPAQGFAQGVTGGRGGRQVWVTSLADRGPGTLRDALARPGPAWVRFAVDGVIGLSAPIRIPSNTTVDGRGAAITVTGKTLRVDGTSNVIITGLSLRNGVGGNTDGVLVQRGARRVWLDHLDIAGFPDEAIDISQGATQVTVSWTRIHHQDKGILIGSWGDNTSTESIAHVTVHHSWFDRTHQRNPRAVRHSRVHAYNNYVHGWTGQAMSVANWAQLVSEGNVVVAERAKHALTTNPTRPGPDNRSPAEGYARVRGDLLRNGARQAGVRRPERVFDPARSYRVEVARADDALRNQIVAHTGARPLPDGPAWLPAP